MLGILQFGVYELDRDAMELRKHGLPLRLQEQPFRILAALVERPGQIVTREELRELIWGKDTFVDFEQSLNKAVNRVREALNDDAGHPQYVETVPRRGYRFIAPVTGNTPAEPYRPTQPQGVVSDLDVRKSGSRGARSRKTAMLAIAGLLAALGGITAITMFGKWKKPGLREPQHITSSGFAPTLSRDGKLLAYVSNLSDNVPHIWLKQTAGGEATQVTRGPDPDFSPEFSPDGTRIIFTSKRGGGGIYVTPTLPGEPKLVVSGAGDFSRFAPRGDEILYWDDADLKVKTVTLDGGLPVPLRLNQDFQVVGAPGWGTEPILSPSGDKVIFYGNRRREPEKLNEWWIAPLNGSKPRQVHLPAVDQPNEMFPSVRGWTRTKDGRDWILYSTSTGNAWKLWRIMTSASGEIAAAPELLTSGTGVLDIGGSLSEDGKLAYNTWTFSESIYELPVDGKGRKVGPTQQIPFPEEADDSAPSLSRDGRWMEYAALRLGNPKTTRLRDLRTGTDRLLDDKGSGGTTSLSPDGSKVAFESECREGKTPTGYPAFCTFILPAGGGKREQVCGLCSPGGFSSNGSVLLIDRYSKLGDVKTRIAAVDLTTNTEKDFLGLPDKDLHHASFSWDDRWVVVIMMTSLASDQTQIMIAPVGRGASGNAAEWIAVTDGRYSDDKPQFSPDGNTVYYTSTRDGYLCIWAQKLDPTTKHPVGVPAPFEHFHNAAGRDAAAYFQHQCDFSVASDKMLINLPRVSKDIWVVQVE